LRLAVVDLGQFHGQEIPAAARSRHLWYLLRYTRPKKAKDCRDKIYAILDLVVDVDRSVIYPNYCISTAALYTKLARYLLQSQRRLDILGAVQLVPPVAGRERGLDLELDLPTWVPDWSLPAPYDIIGGHRKDDEAWFSAGTSKDMITEEVCNDPAVLRVKGRLIDVVHEIHETGKIVSDFEKGPGCLRHERVTRISKSLGLEGVYPRPHGGEEKENSSILPSSERFISIFCDGT
jgi:hypothetical protein